MISKEKKSYGFRFVSISLGGFLAARCAVGVLWRPCKVANEIGVPAEDSVVLFHRLRQALNICREQLQTFSQRAVFTCQALNVHRE